MDLLILIGLLIVLGILANVAGTDSRDSLAG
jgi:hypothetical protein